MTTAMAESSITYIDGDAGILRYRGYPIEQLAEKSTYVEVAYLLLHGELPNAEQAAAWEKEITYHTYIHENVRKRFLEGFNYDAHPMGMLVSAIAALSTYYKEAKILDDPEILDKQIVRLIAKMPTLAAAAHRFSVGMPFVYPDNSLSYAQNFLSMMWKVAEPTLRAQSHSGPRPRRPLHPARRSRTELRDDGDARRRVLARRSVLRHRRRHRRALRTTSRRSERSGTASMLVKIGSVENVPAYVETVKQGKTLLEGFGHRVYKNFDPRAMIIKKIADDVFSVTGKNPLLDIALKLEEVALADDYFISRKLYPNVDFYSGLIYQAMGFPPEMFTVLFAIPRTSGWLAHYQELLSQDTKIARPRQLYIGRDARDFVPMSERS